jgi:PIN domain nuclease of toxin-antitoxin system
VVEAAVTDTHPLLFHAAGGRRLGRRAAEVFEAAERRAAVIYVPVAVIWETALLAWARRIDLQRPLSQFFGDLFSSAAYQPFELTPDQVYAADAACPNRDPFDALVCAAARHLDLPLLTRDRYIRDSGRVEAIW